MNTLGERIAYYRKQKGLSQEKLAEMLDISRQAVTKWEHNQTRPSTDNLIKLTTCLGIAMTDLLGEKENNPSNIMEDTVSENTYLKTTKKQDFSWASLCCTASIVCVMLYIISGIITKMLSAGVAICMVCIAVMIQLFLHIYLSSAVKSGNFGGIAGFDSHVEYNMAEVKKLLERMDLQISIMSLAYVILLLISAYAQIEIPLFDRMNSLTGMLILMYTVELTFTIIYMNYKAQDLIFIHEADQRRAKAGYISTFTYIVIIFATIAVTFVTMEWKRIENNSAGGGKLAGYILLICIVATIGLLLEQGRIKKMDIQQERYKVGKGFAASVVISCGIMVLMCFS